MLAKNHAIFGPTFYVALGMAIPELPVTWLGVLCAMLASLLPDIDHPQSFVGRRLQVVSIPISKVFGHRGITHSALAVCALAYFLFHYFNSIHYTLTAFAIGYLSHLVADFMTKTGVPFLWPFKVRWRIPFVSFKTGSPTEFAVVNVLAALTAASYFGVI